MKLLTGAVLAVALLSACSDDGTDPVDGDAGTGPDSSGICAVSASYGDVGSLSPALAVRRDDEAGEAEVITYIGALNGDQDQVLIQLYRGYTVFIDGKIGPGTYQLTGDELDYATCGVCVRIYADRLLGAGEPLQDMMATSGTLVITEVGASGSGAFKATLSNASFQHVYIEPMSYATSPADDGCGTEISNLTADVPMNAAP